MAYHFISITTGESFTCSDETWLGCLSIALNEGWKPDGTVFDYQFVLHDLTDEDDEIMHALFMGLVVHHAFLNWDGSFTERANQIVSYDDAHYLALHVKGLIDDTALMEFIAKGSFRICET